MAFLSYIVALQSRVFLIQWTSSDKPLPQRGGIQKKRKPTEFIPNALLGFRTRLINFLVAYLYWNQFDSLSFTVILKKKSVN